METTRALHKAVEDGDLATAERLLQADPYLVASREDYKLTPLHRAAIAGHETLAEALLSRAADVNARDYAGGAPLHAAAALGRHDVAAVLLNNGADVNAKDREERTSLYLAAGGGHTAIVALLLAKGADPNARGQITPTPLHQAAQHGFLPVVELLLAHGGLANARSGASHTPWTPWHAARDAGHGQIADLLRDHGGQDRAASAIPIHRAAEFGYAGRVKLMLDQEPALVSKPDYLYRRTPLHWAANNGHRVVTELLLARAADIGSRDKSGDTPLDRAKAMGHLGLADLLRTHGAEEG